MLGISAIITPIAVIQVAYVANTLAKQQDCELELSSDMRRAVGLGLAAVAADDPEALDEQADLLKQVAVEEC